MKIEVSNGEIVDKLTILEIKKDNSEGEKLKNIMEELNYLKPIVAELNIPISIVNQLREVNKNLWDVEDMLRDCEREQTFDQHFITLARAVYHTNGARFKLKTEINKITGSHFVEEKIHPE
jgi:hypothetical protein